MQSIHRTSYKLAGLLVVSLVMHPPVLAQEVPEYMNRRVTTTKELVDRDKEIEVHLNSLNQKVAKHPTEAALYLERGDCFYLQGRLKNALADYDRYIAIDTKTARAYYQRARTFEDLCRTHGCVLSINGKSIYEGRDDEWEDAIKWHEQELIKSPENVQFRKRLGNARLRFGNRYYQRLHFSKAAEQYALAVEVDPGCQSARRRINDLRRRNKITFSAPHGYPFDAATKAKIEQFFALPTKYQRSALIDYGRAIDLAPHSAKPRERRAELRKWLSDYKGIEDYAGAIQDYSAAIANGSVDTTVYFSRAECYRALKYYGPAIADFTRFLEPDGKPLPISEQVYPSETHDAYTERAYLYVATRNWLDALHDLNMAILIQPTDDLLNARADVYEALNEHALAEKDRKSAARLGFSGLVGRTGGSHGIDEL